MKTYLVGQKMGRMAYLLAMAVLVTFVDAPVNDKALVWTFMSLCFLAVAFAPSQWPGWRQLPSLVILYIPTIAALAASLFMLAHAGGLGVVSALAVGMAWAGAIGGALTNLTSAITQLMGQLRRYWRGR